MKRNLIEFLSKEANGSVVRVLVDLNDVKMIKEDAHGCILYFFSQDKTIWRMTDSYNSVIERLNKL